ncbi:MAG: tyrosine-protein phosphatase [Negativicutes bacterium]
MKLRTYDLHSHILPGLDDGSPDDEVSQAMLRIATESGTTDIFATPHTISGSYLSEWETILEQVQRLNRYAAANRLSVKIHPGAEVALDWSLLELLTKPGPYCLGGGRFILVEMPLGSLPTYADEFLFTLQTRDFLPVLGHPERNPEVKKDPLRLQPWIDRGIFVQMNASSLIGTMGSRTQATAVKLLEAGRVHFIGSDAHGVGVRRPDLREVSAILKKLVGDDGERVLLQNNPERLLRGQPDDISAPRAIMPSPPTDWRSRIKALWR